MPCRCRYKRYYWLTSTGIDFSGKIVIVKYGGVFRGLKIKGESDLPPPWYAIN
jgi:N-acetylated-alpha-linked acidic dipeptidase